MTVNEKPSDSLNAPEIATEGALVRRVHTIFALIFAGAASSAVVISNMASATCLLMPVALGCGVAALSLAVKLRAPAADVPQAYWIRAVRGWGISLACTVTVGALLIGLASLGAVRLASMSAVSTANLRGLGQALRKYYDDTGAFPQSWAPLIERGLTTPKQCICPSDLLKERMVRETAHGSYILIPPEDGWPRDERLIIAHERLPWSHKSATIWPEPGFSVLFADGNVRVLTIDEMAEAVARDRERRKALGWPLPP